MENDVLLLINQMSGGGAERVVSMLASKLSQRGYKATIILTNQSMVDADLSRITGRVEVISILDKLKSQRVQCKKIRIMAIKVIAKFERVFFPKGKARQLIKIYKVRNYDKFVWLKKYLSEHRESTLIAFLYHSIFLTLLAANKTNKVVISDRGDPEQSLSSRTDMAFFELLFKKADEMVFQSPDVRQWYRDRFHRDGKIIFNPITLNLPELCQGIRKKRVVNFCRISSQKNLDLLITSFEFFSENHNDFSLYIYGDPYNAELGYIDFITNRIQSSLCKDKIYLLPAMTNIHEEILDYSMFVSSSDFEGMSNSMLEAMAIGLPTICTDCPAGGARAVIKDHVNGLLTPVGDAEALCRAMCEVAENPDLAEKMSKNAVKIRDEQSVDRIINQWEKIIND